MIKVIDDWYITVDSNPVNYTLRRGTGEKDKKGSYKDKPIGYYTSLRSALEGARKEIAARRLQTDFLTLSDAARILGELDTRFECLLTEVAV